MLNQIKITYPNILDTEPVFGIFTLSFLTPVNFSISINASLILLWCSATTFKIIFLITKTKK